MPAGVSSVAAMNGNYISQIYADALFVARARNLMSGLVQVFSDRTGDESRANSEYPQLTSQSVAETEDFSNPTQWTKDQIANLTPGEIMTQALLTDRRMETDPQNARNDVSRELGESIADKVEKDLLSVFPSLTGGGGTIGVAGTAMTWGHLFAARARLAGTKVPGPYVAVFHEYQWFNLAKSASVAGVQTNAAPSLLEAVNSTYYVGRVIDMDLYVSANITIDGNDDAYGAVFNRAAIALDSRRAPRLEPERDASRRAWELNITAKYAYGVWRPKFGVPLLFDATAPAS